MKAGVEIYEYTPGVVHAKCYLADDEIAMVDTINMDHRSLVHDFENGVWLYCCDSIPSIKDDFANTFTKSIRNGENKANCHWLRQFIRSVAKVLHH